MNAISHMGSSLDDFLKEEGIYHDTNSIAIKRFLTYQDSLKQVEAGQVVDGDDVLDWIESWGSANEKQPPKP